MKQYSEAGPIEEVKTSFESGSITIALSALLPVKSIPRNIKASNKYKQILASIREIGVVEPPVVSRKQQDERHLLLDGLLRVEALKDLGETNVECIVSTDDEAFTYNKRINRLSAVQEQRMIAKAIERGVPRERIARALGIDTRSVARKVQLLDGICTEAVSLLKEKLCPMAIFDVLRKMRPMRQIEAAELLINANNYTVSYVSAILTATPQSGLVEPTLSRRPKGLTIEAMGRMERELAQLQQAIASVQDSYGQDHLHLTVVKGYLSRLVENERISQYLAKYQPDFLREFQHIAAMTSSLPSEAA